jgi:hypothetical protein
MTIAVDFDGVIHKYSRGWGNGDIYDDPMPGAFMSLEILMHKEPVFIHTARSPRKVADWIEEKSGYNIECTTRHPRKWYGVREHFWNRKGILLVTNRKYPATTYVDDRGYRFTSWDAEIMGHLRISLEDAFRG